ncbi:MAG TPA: phosphohydrolase [Bradyrhizobium sp.]|nr:phosphohydrolase [Bradyrhizobium sp.]
MTKDRRGDWMQTFTGKQFWPLDPRASEIDIVDIAHALSLACRYAGHVRHFYSVAEHCVLLAGWVPPEARLWALLHDASEAYLVDVPRPLKPFLPGYREAEAAVMAVVAQKFGLGPDMPGIVAEGDNRILHDERAQAMRPCVAEWDLPGHGLGVRLNFWSPWTAEEQFLALFETLTGWERP